MHEMLLMKSAGSGWNGVSGPGPQEIIYGDDRLGYFASMPPEDFITVNDLVTLTGVAMGGVLSYVIPWQKMIIDGVVVFFPRSAIKNQVSWQGLSNYNVISGQKVIQIRGFDFKVRLFRGTTGALIDANGASKASGSEWNRLTSPLLKSGFDPTLPNWQLFTDSEMGSGKDGRTILLQERVTPDNYLYRGNPQPLSIGQGGANTTSSAGPYSGWKPLLELITQSQARRNPGLYAAFKEISNIYHKPE